MAQQEEGWPLGLQPLNARIGLGTVNRDNPGSISFNTLITASPSSSTDSSSDLDTESTGSFFPDKSTTLGSLIGVSSIVELSRRSLRGVRVIKTETLKSKKPTNKSNCCSCFCFCFRTNSDAQKDDQTAPSLAHFLAVERRAANGNTRNQGLPIYGPDDEFALSQITAQPNSLFLNGNIAPPRSSPGLSADADTEKRELGHNNNGFGSHWLSCFHACVAKRDFLFL